eukprot:gene25874-biopygen13563
MGGYGRMVWRSPKQARHGPWWLRHIGGWKAADAGTGRSARPRTRFGGERARARKNAAAAAREEAGGERGANTLPTSPPAQATVPQVQHISKPWLAPVGFADIRGAPKDPGDFGRCLGRLRSISFNSCPEMPGLHEGQWKPSSEVDFHWDSHRGDISWSPQEFNSLHLSS